MKKLGFTLALVMISFVGFSQNFSVGPKIGMSSSKLDLKEKNYVPGDAEFGYHVGAFARIGGIGFFVQPEVLFTQTKGTYSFSSSSGSTPSQLKANFNRLDMPVMMGMRMMKIFRIQAGPIASFDINSGLKNSLGADQKVDFKKATFGYQAGVGLDIGNFIVDAKYESSLGNVIDNVAGFNTDQRLAQWILSVGFKLF
jgi:hypothetical protein